MLKFLSYMLNNYYQQDNGKKAWQVPVAQYDEDGNYIDPKVGKLTTEELLIPADKARILASKSIEDVKVQARKQIFYRIHQQIKAGKSSIRFEQYQIKPEMLTYLIELGYTIETITPPTNNRSNQFAPTNFINEIDDGNEILGEGPYTYYRVSWGATPSTDGMPLVPGIAQTEN
jgi:hypothetical protein